MLKDALHEKNKSYNNNVEPLEFSIKRLAPSQGPRPLHLLCVPCDFLLDLLLSNFSLIRLSISRFQGYPCVCVRVCMCVDTVCLLTLAVHTCWWEEPILAQWNGSSLPFFSPLNENELESSFCCVLLLLVVSAFMRLRKHNISCFVCVYIDSYNLPSHFSFSAGDVHTWVQVQGVCFRELLCDLLVHRVPPAGVGSGLVPRPHQGGTSHEGQPGQEN